MLHHQKSIYILSLLVVLFVFLEKCIQPTQAKDARGKMYAGAASCRQCHAAIYDAYLNTAHAQATAAADSQSMLGSFA
jgi:hypothetical protein